MCLGDLLLGGVDLALEGRQGILAGALVQGIDELFTEPEEGGGNQLGVFRAVGLYR